MSSPEKRSLLSRITPNQWIALVITVLAVIFVAANRNKVSIEFLLVSVTSPLWLILLVMFVIGWIAGLLTARSRRRR
ncbi:lipopolysaccharide assembly protein LapA domain-containing protein [Nocardia sp. NPDC052001]|uniref:lipopolysaccharide assembly protein LapA domain-containing protein n=1 Tax=unclassified Nocardia TaxID=2637762 RepID=UPI00343A5533